MMDETEWVGILLDDTILANERLTEHALTNPKTSVDPDLAKTAPSDFVGRHARRDASAELFGFPRSVLTGDPRHAARCRVDR